MGSTQGLRNEITPASSATIMAGSKPCVDDFNSKHDSHIARFVARRHGRLSQLRGLL